MKGVRFASILWLLVLPILAGTKIFLELNSPTPAQSLLPPLPVSWLDSSFPINLYLGIALVFVAIYMTFAYVNAYIKIQTTYAVALFFGVLIFLVFTPTLLSTFIASSLFMLGIFQQFSLREKVQRSFVIFDTGLFIGLALLFDLHFLVLIFCFSIFLPFSLKRFLQFWSGVFLPLLFVLPILFFTNSLTDWIDYTQSLVVKLQTLPHLPPLEYGILAILTLFCFLQIISLFKQHKNLPIRRLTKFLFLYFVAALLCGIFAHHSTQVTILLITPPITLLYSLSKYENQIMPIILLIATLIYFTFNSRIYF